MNKKKILKGLTMSLVLALGSNWVHAEELPFIGEFSGSFVNTQFDTNGDGLKATLSTAGVKGLPGPRTFQSVVELAFTGHGTCPNGHAGLMFMLVPGTGHGAGRFTNTGDQLFTELTEETMCLDPATRTQFFSGTETFTGGTGRYAGAQGSAKFTGTARTLFNDTAGNFFGEFSGKSTGALILPKP